MLRCHYCGKHAMVGLAHLHGLTVPLCVECSDKVVEKLELVKCSECKKKSKGEVLQLQCTEFDSDKSNLRAA